MMTARQNEERRYYLGIDLGGTKIKAGLFSIGNASQASQAKVPFPDILRYAERQTLRSREKEEILGEIIGIAKSLLEGAERPAAIGLSCPGIIDSREKILRRAPLLAGWKDVPLGSILESELGLPVHMDNDANAAALGENKWGSGAGTSTSVYVTVSTGLGVGIVVDDHIWRGFHGIAGEIGHIPLFEKEVFCENGHNGCAEAFCTGTAISQRASRAAGRDVPTEEVFELAAKNDAFAMEVVDDAVKYLAKLFLFLQMALDPEMIIMGGGVILGQPSVVAALEKAMREFVDYPYVVPNLSVSTLKNKASLYGSVALCVFE